MKITIFPVIVSLLILGTIGLSHDAFAATTFTIIDDPQGGDCILIGIWDSSTLTCTLNTNLGTDDTIIIGSDGITLDGNGHSMTGTQTQTAVTIHTKTDVTVKNLVITNYSIGINIANGDNLLISNNDISSTRNFAISTSQTNNSVISDNTVFDNSNNAIQLFNSNNNNVIKNNSVDQSSSIGIRVDGDNNLIEGNTLTNHSAGLRPDGLNNQIVGNTISDNSRGIVLVTFLGSSSNTFFTNIIQNNQIGIDFFAAQNPHDNNVFFDNLIQNNNIGIELENGNNNQFYNNNFLANPTNYNILGGTGNIFDLPLPVGGNYYDNFDESVEGCDDNSPSNAICDLPFIFSGGQDNSPWTSQNGWHIPIVGDILVADTNAFGLSQPAVFKVDPSSGFRSVFSDFTDATQGPTSLDASGITIDVFGNVWVVATNLDNVQGRGALFKLDPITGQRVLVSDFADSTQGPLGLNPFRAASDSVGNIFVTDFGATSTSSSDAFVFKVDPVTGTRTILSSFDDTTQGAIGGGPFNIAIDSSDNIFVNDFRAGISGKGYVLGIDPATGFRTIISDLNNPTQGDQEQRNPHGLAIDASGNLIITTIVGGTNSLGLLVSVDPTTGFRTTINDFGDTTQGPIGDAAERAVAIDSAGDYIVLDERAGSKGTLFEIDSSTLLRISLSDFSDSLQGQTGNSPFDVVIVEQIQDADGDGIPDHLDICPGFDDNADADGDGVPDGCDFTPSTVVTADTVSGDAPLEVSFTCDSATGNLPLSYSWDFDNDGTEDSTQQNPTHTFNDVGVFDATCTVIDADGDADSESIAITVEDPVIIVTFDVKPDGNDTINCKSKGVTPVGLFSTSEFDATTLDLDSLFVNDVAISEKHNKLHINDIDGDGLEDVLLHLPTKDICSVISSNGPTEVEFSGTASEGEVNISGSQTITFTGLE